MEKNALAHVVHALSACAALLTLHAGDTHAVATVYVGSQSSGRPNISLADVDQAPWHDLLQQYVDPSGRVDYQAWHRNPADRARLEKYLRSYSRVQLAGSDRKQRLAFWINAYNALTIHGILREYPTDSIRNHTARFFGYNIWDDLQVWVDGKPYSLNQIEHEVLRPMREPRIHFAIVCASVGCPRLRDEAYVAARLEEQLTANAKHFFAQKENLDIRGNKITLSAILDWFGEDFGSDQNTILRRIQPFWPERFQSTLSKTGLSIRYADYDWSLNTQ
ncbi:MAG: DUF547 domain-containing protein [Planctomycetota bacterium]